LALGNYFLRKFFAESQIKKLSAKNTLPRANLKTLGKEVFFCQEQTKNSWQRKNTWQKISLPSVFSALDKEI
jgi:hypothetical protein